MTASHALAVARNLHMRIVAAKNMLADLITDAKQRRDAVITTTLSNATVDADELNEFLEDLISEELKGGSTQ